MTKRKDVNIRKEEREEISIQPDKREKTDDNTWRKRKDRQAARVSKGQAGIVTGSNLSPAHVTH